MGFYQSIRKLGRKMLLAGGLVAILASCDSTTEYKTSQIFQDLNGDGKPEHVYMVNSGKDENRDDWYDYDLFMKKGLGEGSFGEPVKIFTFPKKPEEVNFADLNDDKTSDLVYLIHTGQDYNKDGWYDFDLMMKPNDGNGNFGEPKLIQRFDKAPEGLH